MSLCKECQYCRLLHGDMWEINVYKIYWNFNFNWVMVIVLYCIKHRYKW